MGITTKRSLSRKFTDYSAVFLLLPLLMVCSAGISIFMSDAVQRMFAGHPISPMMHRMLAFTPTVISWLVFTAAYYLIPNTKVSFKGALFSGILCGTLFQAVEWLFVTGQVYVSKYNAIYGSFAFLPLALVWMQLSWLITLAGIVLTYAWQNFDNFSHLYKAADASQAYTNDIATAVLVQAAMRFKRKEPAITRDEIIRNFDIPISLADQLLSRLQQAGLLTPIANSEDKDKDTAYQPAYDPDDMTFNDVCVKLAEQGNDGFIHAADTGFAGVLDRIAELRKRQQDAATDVPLTDLFEP